MLRWLVHFMNTTADSEISLTAVCPGGVVTGLVIPKHKWFKLWREQLDVVGGAFLADVIQNAKDEGVTMFDDEYDGDWPLRAHLRNTYIDDRPGSALMRLELSDVTAWTLGNSPPAD